MIHLTIALIAVVAFGVDQSRAGNNHNHQRVVGLRHYDLAQYLGCCPEYGSSTKVRYTRWAPFWERRVIHGNIWLRDV